MRRWGSAALVCSAVACAKAPLDDVHLTAGLGSASMDGSSGVAETGSTGDGSVSSSMTSTTDPATTQPGDTGDPSASGTSGGDPESTGVATDEGSASTGTTDPMPPMPFCGDGNIDPGEACDDANAVDTDACLSNCTAASCGDAIVEAGVEACDDGTNDGSYGGCNQGCASLAPHCGDGAVQASYEHCDGATGYVNVGCTGCLYDFSTIPQLYCNGTCTWAGAQDCDQADADIYCKLVTGDSTSVANSYQIVTALDSAGFSCPGYGTNLGALPAFGVNVNVWYQDTSILANHGAGYVIAQAQCS